MPWMQDNCKQAKIRKLWIANLVLVKIRHDERFSWAAYIFKSDDYDGMGEGQNFTFK